MSEEQNNRPASDTLVKELSRAVSGGRPNRRGGPGGPRRNHQQMKPVVRRIKILPRAEDNAPRPTKEGGLKIVHLGGLGEVGRNMSAIQYDDEIILIDAGVRFPEGDMPGIESIGNDDSLVS